MSWPCIIRVRCHSVSSGTETDRSTFLLAFYSNQGPISYRFRDKWRFQLKIAKFSHPRVFCAPAEGVPIGIGYRRWGTKKSIMLGLPDRERSLMISSSAVWTQYTNVTDGQTPDNSKDRAYARCPRRRAVKPHWFKSGHFILILYEYELPLKAMVELVITDVKTLAMKTCQPKPINVTSSS